MPKNLAAIKRIQIASRNNLRNKSYKSSIKTMIKKVLFQINSNELLSFNELTILVARAYSKIDKAVKKGVIPKNNAARKKSMLAQKLKSITKSL